MPTIPVISPKGGVGKTTTALVLALQLVARGAQVTLIDADPNQPVRDWAEGGNAPEGLTIVCKSRSGLDLHGVVWRDITADTIRELITEFAAKSQFVICDLEGTAELIVASAIAEADFVCVPCGGSALDSKQAARAVALIRAHERTVQKYRSEYKLPYGIVFTRTSVAIESRETSFVRKAFEAAGLPVFKIELNERAAFKSMHSYRVPLTKLNANQVAGIDNAIQNAEALTREIIVRLRDALEDKRDAFEDQKVKVAS